jgi:hypothetical protein
VWIAEVDAAGNVEIAGQDIDWTPIRIPSEQVAGELALQRGALLESSPGTAMATASRVPLASQWIINDSKRAWVVSVLMVAAQKRPRRGDDRA